MFQSRRPGFKFGDSHPDNEHLAVQCFSPVDRDSSLATKIQPEPPSEPGKFQSRRPGFKFGDYSFRFSSDFPEKFQSRRPGFKFGDIGTLSADPPVTTRFSPVDRDSSL